MSYQLDCFDNIIGLSRTECECYDAGKPADYNTSLSGLYLDELVPITSYKGLLNCENGNDIWQMLDRAREQAILTFRADANALMLKDHQLKRKKFKGNVGRLKYTGEEVITDGTWVGVRIVCDDVVSGKLRIKNIGTIFSETGAFDLYIRNNMNEIVDIIPLTTIANTHDINDITDIELDMHSDYVENLEYFLMYQKTAALTPKNNSSDDLSSDRCGVGSQTNVQYGWLDWASIEAFKMTDISDLSDVSGTGSCDMYGLTLDIEFICKVEEVWCKSSLDFEADNIARGMALAIRFKAGELFFNEHLLSENVNFNRLINGEGIDKAREIFAEGYATMMEFLAENIDVTTTDCFECMDRIPLLRGLITS